MRGKIAQFIVVEEASLKFKTTKPNSREKGIWYRRVHESVEDFSWMNHPRVRMLSRIGQNRKRSTVLFRKKNEPFKVFIRVKSSRRSKT